MSSLPQPRLVLFVLFIIYVVVTVYRKIALHLKRREFKKQHGCKPPQNRFKFKDPIFHLDPVIQNMKAASKGGYMDNNVQRFKKNGNTMGSYLIWTPTVNTIEPENIKAILTLKFKDFHLSQRETLIPLLGLGIFTTNGEDWAHSRSLIRPNFARDQVADLKALELHVQDMFKKIPRDGSSVDLQDLFFRLTMDSATEFLFGESTHTLRDSTEGSDFAEAFNFSQHQIAKNFRMGVFGKFLYSKKYQESIKIVHKLVDGYVDAAVRYRETHDLEKSPKHGQYVFLYELAKATPDRTRLRSELLNVLLAGRDTTAGLLGNLFFVLARRPDIWVKLREEVSSFNGRLPNYEQLRNAKYLKYCLNEALRLYPPVPVNGRTAVNDTTIPLGGGPDGQSSLFIPKDGMVFYSIWSMHRRKDLYGEDADEFKPERWETLRPGWEYLPFNGGPRICLGQQYALTEAGYVTVRLVQEFAKIESRDSRPWRENLHLTLSSYYGTIVGLTPAKS